MLWEGDFCVRFGPCLKVDVDVYRTAAGARQAPLPGAASFTAEVLAAWRELNTAADFTAVAAEVHNLVHSLPLLLHHKVGRHSTAHCPCLSPSDCLIPSTWLADAAVTPRYSRGTTAENYC